MPTLVQRKRRNFGRDAYLELAVATERAGCGAPASELAELCSRRRFAAPPGGVEDNVQTTPATRRQLRLRALGWGAVDDVRGGSCRPDKIARQSILPGNRQLPRATDSLHTRWELLRPTATESLDDGAAWGGGGEGGQGFGAEQKFDSSRDRVDKREDTLAVWPNASAAQI
jgi:hypothetical protein